MFTLRKEVRSLNIWDRNNISVISAATSSTWQRLLLARSEKSENAIDTLQILGNFLREYGENPGWTLWNRKKHNATWKLLGLPHNLNRTNFILLKESYAVFILKKIFLCRDFPGKDCWCEKWMKVFLYQFR